MKHVILLHGALGARTQLEALKQSMASTDRVVHSLDFSGHHGKPYSEKGFGIDPFASDVVSWMDENDILIADVFGYSMGGYVALWLAHLHPRRVRNVITLGTKFDWSIPSAEKEVRKLDPEKILAKVPAFARILESRHHPIDWKELIEKTAGMMTALGRSPLLTEEIIANIESRVLVCLGDRDDMADLNYSKRVAQLLRHGKFVLFENTPHPIEVLNVGTLVEVWTEFEKEE